MPEDSPRILLFTGKGGVGKTTSAAGAAVLAAEAGHRTLVMSTDAAHSLGDAFGLIGDQTSSAEPVAVAPRLWLQQVDAQRRFESSWAEVQGYLASVLDAAGIDPITAEELTVLPGAEEVLALLELRRQAGSGAYDALVVDCAPTAETLRLLALPEALGWYMDRVFGLQRRAVKALRPVLTRAAGVPMPSDAVFDAVARLHADLDDVRRLLAGPRSSVRLVLTPERVVVAEARRSLTMLSLYGYRVDGVVANRVFAETDDEFVRGWVQAQSAVLREVEESFAGLPIRRSGYLAAEPVGTDAVVALARSVYGDDDPLAMSRAQSPMSIEHTDSGAVLRIALPLAERRDVDLGRHGDELVITVGSHRRLLALPTALARMRVSGARIEEGLLRIRFRHEEEA